MTTKYDKQRKFAENNPGINPRLREYFTKLNSVITWPTTTTTTTTSTTTTSTTTTT